MASPDPASPNAGAFAPTRWTLVLRAQGDSPSARAALSELCEAYYQPVVRFLQREGREEDSARELAQEFFARLLQRGELGASDPARGRFRSYLLGAVRHFLADQRKHARRLKRGGGDLPESIEAASPDGETTREWPDGRAEMPAAWFDREWALAVLGRALSALELEFRNAGKQDQFDHLQVWLVGEPPGLSQVEVARSLGLTEGALKVAIHRLRKRFREVVRAEITQTLAEGDDPDAELRYLIEALSLRS